MTFPSNSGPLEIGARVRLRDAYYDQAETLPVIGTVEAVSPRSDWGGRSAYVVMFDGEHREFPPGGEFTHHRLEHVVEGQPC